MNQCLQVEPARSAGVACAPAGGPFSVQLFEVTLDSAGMVLPWSSAVGEYTALAGEREAR